MVGIVKRAPILVVFITACTANVGGLEPSSSLTDAGTLDAGIVRDAGTSSRDAGTVPSQPPKIIARYEDTCDCGRPPCCPEISLEFQPGSNAAHFFMCGDFVACERPPVIWESLQPGGWVRFTDPEVSMGGGFSCAPETIVNPWSFGVPYPPDGTVRAVGIFTDECGSDPNTCAVPCNSTYEVTSNAIEVISGPIDG